MMQRVVVAKTIPYFFSPISASYAESKSNNVAIVLFLDVSTFSKRLKYKVPEFVIAP